MTIEKCDICKKELKRRDAQFSVALSGGTYDYASNLICLNCGKAIMSFLRKNKLHHEESVRATSRRRK